MRTFSFFTLVLAGALCSLNAYSQTKMGQICFIRSHGYVGSMVNDRVYIDDSLVCKLKNNQYSLHSVPVGDHKVSAIGGGLSGQRKPGSFTVHVEEGQVNYVDVVWANNVSCQEITRNSAEMKMKKLKQNTKCTEK